MEPQPNSAIHAEPHFKTVPGNKKATNIHARFGHEENFY